MNELKKRTWCYVMQPTAYEISCDKCGGTNITWSEFEHCIWCYDCQIDTKGSDGIFDGPIPLNACLMLGLSFDRIDLETGKILKMKHDGNKLTWEEEDE